MSTMTAAWSVAWFRRAGDHHVRVADRLDLLEALSLCERVETAEDLVEQGDNASRRFMGGERREVDDVGKQNGHLVVVSSPVEMRLGYRALRGGCGCRRSDHARTPTSEARRRRPCPCQRRRRSGEARPVHQLGIRRASGSPSGSSGRRYRLGYAAEPIRAEVELSPEGWLRR